MDSKQIHRVDEVLFSFTYKKRQQASRCNSLLHQLMGHSIIPELENSFNQVSYGGILLEIDRLEIDLGTLSEEDISEDLGGKIRQVLVQALKSEIRERILRGMGKSDSKSPQNQDFSVAALKSFFLKGYFPAWIDSNLNLRAILDFLISNFPKILGDLVIEISLKSEAARKRIAFLEAPYFDQIIRILMPEDAKWIFGYRNSYLEIHQTESNLPGSSENLEKAMNFFILTFITRNSGTKFNRLSFSDRFLKSIAAHFNLDFREFLQEITEILRQNTIENQLFRDFKEAIIWVGEKNQIEVTTPEEYREPSFQEFIAWIDQPKGNGHIQAWVDKLAFSGFLFPELSSRYPAFWKSLSKAGLTNLIKLLGERLGDKWLEITYSYLAWNSRQAKTESSNQIGVVKEIFDLASEDSALRGLFLSDLEAWFSVLATHAFSRHGFRTEISKGLLSLGLDAGISHPSSVLIRVKTRSSIREMGREEKTPVPGSEISFLQSDKHKDRNTVSGPIKFHELALIEYLNTGTMGASFRSLGKTDLQWIVAGMIKSSSPRLLKLIKNPNFRKGFILKNRFLGLLEKLNRKEVMDYIIRFAGPQTVNLLRFNEYLAAVLNLEQSLISRLDQEVWNSFLEEFRAENQGKSAGLSSLPLGVRETYFLIFNRIQYAEVSDKILIKALQKKLNSDKSFLVYFALNQARSPWVLSRLENIAASIIHLNTGFGLMDLNQLKAKEYLQRRSLDKANWHFHTSFSREQMHLIVQAGGGSLPKRLLSGEISQKDLTNEARLILERDFYLLVKSSFSKKSDRYYTLELRESIHRIFLSFQSNPEPILVLLRRYKNRFPLILNSLYQNMMGGEWKKFSRGLERNFPEELKFFNWMLDHGYVSVLDTLSSWEGKTDARAILSYSLDQIILRSNGLGLESALASESMDGGFPSGFDREVEFLLKLPSGVFYRKSVSVIWRKALLISAFQVKMESEFGTGDSRRDFWQIFLGYLKEKHSVFSPESMDWNYLIYSDQLKPDTKSLLLRFFKDNLLKNMDSAQDSSGQERIASAVIHLKEEGFLPWWSPIKSKPGLIFSLFALIEHSDKEDALLLVSLFSGEKTSRLIAGINEEQLQKLLLRLSESKYKRHYATLIQAIGRKLEKFGFHSGTKRRIGENGISKKPKSGPDLKDQPSLKDQPRGYLDLWIKKRVNESREAEILCTWFENDPRIQKQLEDFLEWGRFMFFGNLNPGKWKLLLLNFGFEFYLKKGNSYSASFLGQFLGHLTRSHGMVNWKVAFHHLLKNKEFLSGHNLGFKDQILAVFPFDQERKPEEISTGDQVRIANAGLILCWPFLSVLFSRLKLSSGGVIPIESQSRAVYLLQYLAYGHCDFPEYELVLNKVLVGMNNSQHLEKPELTSEEKEMAESLLQGLKSNWEKMKNASVEAIRETFLQREGVLEFGSASNILRVPKTGVDVLLDSVSWNIAVVRLPWMEKSLEVKWR